MSKSYGIPDLPLTRHRRSAIGLRRYAGESRLQNEKGRPDSLNDPLNERRHEARFPCNGETQIIDAESGLELGHGLITDISPSGASVSVYCPLAAGSILELRQGETVYHGAVQYCVPFGPDFRLGIQLIPSEQWCPEKPWPKLRREP